MFFSLTVNERKPHNKKNKKKINARGIFIDDDGEGLRDTRSSKYLEIIVKYRGKESQIEQGRPKVQNKLNVTRIETEHEKAIKINCMKRKKFLEGHDNVRNPPSKKKKKDDQNAQMPTTIDYSKIINKVRTERCVQNAQKLIEENSKERHIKQERKQHVQHLNKKDILKGLGLSESIDKKSESMNYLKETEDILKNQMKDIVPLSVFRSVPGDQFMNLQDIRVKKNLI